MSGFYNGHRLAAFLGEAFAQFLWRFLWDVDRDVDTLLLGHTGAVLLGDGLGNALALGLGNLVATLLRDLFSKLRGDERW